TAGADAVINHLDGRALHALRVKGEDADDDKAHVADGRVRDQLLHVGLSVADPGAIDDADNAERTDKRRSCNRGFREQRQTEADDAVCTHLEQDRGQNDGAGSWSLYVCVW